MFSSVRIQALLRHLQERKAALHTSYPDMNFTIVCPSHQVDISALRFNLRLGVVDVFHAHNSDNYTRLGYYRQLKEFIEKFAQNGVYALAADFEAVSELMQHLYTEEIPSELIEKRVFVLEELELAVLKNIAPNFIDKWENFELERHIEQSYTDCFGEWEKDAYRCCWNVLRNVVVRMWHFMKMVEMSSNIYRRNMPGIHMFGLLFDQSPERNFAKDVRNCNSCFLWTTLCNM